jgi:hypothetical protein
VHSWFDAVSFFDFCEGGGSLRKSGPSEDNLRIFVTELQSSGVIVPVPRNQGRIGGRDRVRTCDPLLAKQVLSQLSYTPTVTA